MAKRTTKRQSKKEYTLDEFKAWLEGIEELQPNNWAPSADQWKTIRDKLMNIVPDAKIPAPPVQPQQTIHPQAPGPALVRQPAPMPAPMQSALPVPETPAEMTPAAKAAVAGHLPPEMVPSADGKVKTPNIDTSQGDYGSSFE